MAKRKVGSEEETPHSKRRKLSLVSLSQHNSAPLGRVIQTSEDLHSLLSTTLLEVDELIRRVRTFKSFLDGIGHIGSKDHNVKIAILLDYLRPRVSAADEDATKFVPDIIKIAHHAGHVNSDNLYSSAMTVLALLLKTISNLHECRDVGNSLCSLLLHESHTKLLEYGMSAIKSKEHLISPCLRLLREVVLFDGGRAAKAVYRLRTITFQRLDVFLTMRGNPKDDEDGTRKRQSVRNTAISYLLANIRLQSRNAKSYILGQHKWMRVLLSDMSNDPPSLVSAIIDALQKEVVEDEGLPLSVKGHFFDDWTLGRLASLYGYDNDSLADSSGSVESSAHKLLETVYASRHHGLLVAIQRRQGQYPQKDDDESDNEDYSSDRGRPDIRRIRQNVLLSLQRLRPHASIPQSDLLLSCFQVSPSLLEQYFIGQTVFTFEPKLSATWIGYSQFLLGIVQQPLPAQLIDSRIGEDQQSMELLIRLILPPPLTQKALTQCFNQSSKLITFFAARTLVAAFEKFAAAKRMLNSNKRLLTTDPELPKVHYEDRLLSAFCKRLPGIKDVVVQFKNCPEENTMLRECISRLLVLYHRETPGLAVEENVDRSLALSNALIRFEEGRLDVDNDGMLLLTSKHIIEIASRSADMHWWHQIGTSLSSYTSLLKLCVSRQQNADWMREILRSVAEETSITWPDTPPGGFDVLVLSLRSQARTDLGDVYAFLDNCFRRVAKKTVIYTEQLRTLIESVPNNGVEGTIRRLPDLLMVTFIEQLPHMISRQPGGPVELVTRFLSIYVEISALRGLERDLLVLVRNRLTNAFTTDNPCRLIMEKALQEPLDAETQAAFASLKTPTHNLYQLPASPQLSDKDIQPEPLFLHGPPAEDENHRGLTRWTREDTLDAITDGAIEELILCLCSAHVEIRKQALAGVKAFMRKLEHSGYREWQQIHLLVGEVAETAGGSEQALPYFAGVLAARLLQVLIDPLHILYEKANIFLSKRPQWTTEKLPSYWVDRVILHPPTDDDSYYQEVEWLLDTLIDGLRSPGDMDIYRRCHAIEHVLTLTASPNLPTPCLEQVIELLFRCTYVDGSTTLITRCGLIGWLSLNMARRDDSLRSKLKVLGRRTYETSDQTRVNGWSNGSLVALLDSLDLWHD